MVEQGAPADLPVRVDLSQSSAHRQQAGQPARSSRRSTRGVAVPRSRRLVLPIVASIVAAALVVGIAAELTVRSRIDAAAASITRAVPGVSGSFAGGLALWSLATGRVPIDLTLDDAAVESVLECRVDRTVSVVTTEDGIGVSTDFPLGDRTVPVRVLLLPQEQHGAWALVPNSVVVAGLTLPPQRVSALLGARAPSWLTQGVPLAMGGQLSITGVSLTQGATRVIVSAPISPGNPGGGADLLAGLRCA